MREERGMAMPLTLLVVMVLATLGLGLLAVGAMEPQISRNVSEGTRARFAAEAGVEWAYPQLTSTADWSTLLAGADLNNGVVLGGAVNRAIPGLTAGRGTFTVRLRNDARPAGDGHPADSAYTGVALDAGGATSDTNGRLVLTSTGQVGTATRSVQVVVRRAMFPPLPAALAFPGNEAETNFNGASFEIDGNDWTYNPATGNGTQTNSCPRVYGITVSDTLGTPPGANEAVVEGSLAANQKQDVKGKSQVDGSNTTGNNTITKEGTLTQAAITQFITAARNGGDIRLESHQASPLSFSNIGSTCAADPNSTTCWGTPDNPKVVYVKGDPDPSSMFTALQLSGSTTGYGILIVEDGDLKISGNFLWNGVILVTGRYVGVGFLGGGNQSVYGTVISNETATDPGFKEGVVVGNAKLRYSCSAIATAQGLRKLVSMNWQELTP
jgi:hypothetical protein